ncbi:DUF4083 domain-containing protein [Rossellomorea sp. SC111]|uniref:DUF4083 domain-containing protein n=1 Tax=Rossellomorea sp. SC111 TaxID=2968985 RepID=UPI00215A967D|nr:DUF4083 domain-containing protein [Rossellomorea sp. SC111]MCR8849977.1 DUF4083 domain-containing protein [Rossellomorea sp. SC111]
MDFNIGDVIFQLFMVALLLAIVVFAFMMAKGLRDKRIHQRKQDKQIEEKLDRIIEKMDQTPK